MARSKADATKDTLRKLGVLDILDDPAAEQAALVEARYDDKLEELRDRGLVYWSHDTRTSEDIPNVVFGAIVNIMCEEMAAAFGVQIPTVMDERGQPVSCGTKGMRDLRRHMAKGPSGNATRADYF